MKYRLIYSAIALEDIADITAYLGQFYPSTTQKVFDKMEKQALSLQERPFLYPKYQRMQEYRKMPVDEYLVFYRVNEKNETVEICRILHGQRNIYTA